MRSESDSEWEDDPTLVARKRRMVARSSKGRNDEESSPHKRGKFQPLESPSSSSSSSCAGDDMLSALPGVKKYSRYEPELPDEELAHWSKEELSEWRKKARKVRNRESAAASRRKTRDRINELEAEVQGLKSKYQEALERIKVLMALQPKKEEIEAETATTAPQVVSPPPSVSPDLASVTRSPPSAPLGESWSLNEEHEFYSQGVVLDPLDHHHHHHFQHLISRPTAVCV